MKPENQKKMLDLAQKYPDYFAYMVTCIQLEGVLNTMDETREVVLKALPPENQANIIQQILTGGDEIEKVLREIKSDEAGEISPLPKLSDDENKVVDDLLSRLDFLKK